MKDDNRAICFRNGIKAYPVHLKKLVIKGKEIAIDEKGEWFIEVDNNKKKTVYPKSLKKGGVLHSYECKEQLDKTYAYWAKIIKENIK